MRPNRLPLLWIALLAAGSATAGDRVDLQIRLTLVDSCEIRADARGRAHPVRVECTSAQPYLVQARSAAWSPATSGVHTTGPTRQPGYAPGLTIVF